MFKVNKEKKTSATTAEIKKVTTRKIKSSEMIQYKSLKNKDDNTGTAKISSQ